ncbi:hypothetical protein N825_04920 [Skermanella stibiiresistens SB22]|uniref:Glycosyltransferase 61 catalytic domain-containing protein n=1 Tax=Skermanella stibiiresistens SB22 TaxID=1385369 RepID=W9H556_9PROT|nr:glycosyltransferase 61 family protein [Skermanella stibiiresistens]EWY39921.1 hypothetical protein N825_04920 [Skermanella stibiiresistens SB22]
MDEMRDLAGLGSKPLFERARERLLAGDLDAADTLLQRGRSLAPDDGAMAYLHGLCLMRRGDGAAAATAFTIASRADPRDGRAVLMLTRALRDIGHTAEMGRLRAELARDHPNDAALLGEIASDLLEEGDEPTAAALLERVIEVAPDDPGALHNLGVACARLGSLERAETLLRRALAKGDRGKEGGQSRRRDASEAVLAGVLATRGFGDEATTIARGLLERGAEVVHAWTVLGTVAARRRRFGEAVDALLEAEALAPDDPGVLSNLAGALDDGGRRIEALERWRRLAATGHADAAARVRLATRTPAVGEAIRRLFPLSGRIVAENGGAGTGTVELDEVDLCADQWHLIDGDGLALDLVFTPPLGRDNFVVSADGEGNVLVRDDLERRRMDDAVVFLGGTTNYYHWLLDTLPRLAAIEGLDGPLLVNSALTVFQTRTLDLMGVEQSRLIVSDPASLTRFRRLTVPGLVARPRRVDGQMDWMRPSVGRAAAGWVRDQLLAGVGGGASKARRIFVSREGSLFRRCDNEAAVRAVVARHGFETVRLEDLSFDEQVSLFGGAEIVIGVHGAGFTNMLFAPRGALLIELHPAHHLPEFYRHLTGLMGQRHKAIPGVLTQALRPTLEYNWNFRIDPADVDLCLAAL